MDIVHFTKNSANKITKVVNRVLPEPYDRRRSVTQTRPNKAVFDYKGSFFIQRNEDNTIQIWDKEESETYDDSTRAGFFIHGLEYEDLEVLSEEITVTESGSIVARLEYDIDTEIYTTSFVVMPTFNSGDSTTYNKKIGYVVFEDSKIINIEMTWFGGDIEVTGRG